MVVWKQHLRTLKACYWPPVFAPIGRPHHFGEELVRFLALRAFCVFTVLNPGYAGVRVSERWPPVRRMRPATATSP